MKAIKQLGPKCQSVGEAQDCLAGTSVVSGFLFGYVDEKAMRCISFFTDFNPDEPACTGQEQITLMFRPTEPEQKVDLGFAFAFNNAGKPQ